MIPKCFLTVILLAGTSLTYPFESEDEISTFVYGEYLTNTTATNTEYLTALWNYDTDVQNETKSAILTETLLQFGATQKYFYDNYFKDIEPANYSDGDLQSILESLKTLGTPIVDSETYSEFTNTIRGMQDTYNFAKICPYSNQDCDLDIDGLSYFFDIEDGMSQTTDYDELVYIWKAWRDAIGPLIKDSYQTYVNISNDAAVLNGFDHMGDLWNYKYELQTGICSETLDSWWLAVKPLYDELHTYVGNKLKERYGDAIDISDGLIPENVFGNLWAQKWISLKDLVRPYPNSSIIDLTSTFNSQGYDVLSMFQLSDKFYQSLGFDSSAAAFDRNIDIIQKPNDTEVLCYASAWDFQDGEDYRIKMCGRVNSEDYKTINAELAYISYGGLVPNRPVNNRPIPANPWQRPPPGVHNPMVLSTSSPQYLESVNLLENYEISDESTTNYLMDTALDMVAFLPFGYMVDKWRYDVFSGVTPTDEWNSQWWMYKNTVQKVKAPVERTESDFDPGAKYHIPADVEFKGYFAGEIVGFQLYRGLCALAGQYDPEDENLPLYNCDLSGNTEVGDKIKAGWDISNVADGLEVLNTMIGEDEYDPTAILEYFQPLYDWLLIQNSC